MPISGSSFYWCPSGGGQPFVATLVDWRLFENPFLNLSDIFVPVAEFPTFDQVFERLPDLAASLAENVTGGDDPVRQTEHNGRLGRHPTEFSTILTTR